MLPDEIPIPVTNEELLRKVSDTENSFIERKPIKAQSEWLRTAVAFANSCPIGQPGILYVGVDDNGQVERINEGTDFEVIEKNVSAKIKQAWPPIYFNSHILKKDDPEFIAVVIFGSSKRPHFSGPAREVKN